MGLLRKWKQRRIQPLSGEEAKVASERVRKAMAEREGGSANPEAENEDESGKRAVSYPDAIMRSAITQFLIGALVFLVCLTAVLAMKQIGFAFGFLFSAYLLYNGATLLANYKSGLIKEYVLLCTTVLRQLSSTKIVMQDVTVDPAKIYSFYMPKKNCPFYENCVYLVYINEKNPHQIAAWNDI